MAYRISLTVDIYDVDNKATTDTARRTYDALSDMQEAAAKHDGDLQYDDVEWYGYTADVDELTQNSWTYGDEELLRHAVGWGDDIDPEDRLRNEAENDDHYDRLVTELRKRQAVTDLAAHVRYLDQVLDSLPDHDPKLHAVILYLRGQLRK